MSGSAQTGIDVWPKLARMAFQQMPLVFTTLAVATYIVLVLIAFM